MGNTTIIDKLKQAVSGLGAEIKIDPCGLVIVRYNDADYLFDPDEKKGGFFMVQTIMGLEGNLTQNEFEIMWDVVRTAHTDYRAEWSEGVAYLYSPWYDIHDSNELNGAELERIIKDFDDVWSFACANACLITDTSV